MGPLRARLEECCEHTVTKYWYVSHSFYVWNGTHHISNELTCLGTAPSAWITLRDEYHLLRFSYVLGISLHHLRDLHYFPHTQIQTILVPLHGLQGVPIQCEGLSPTEMSMVYEAISRNISMKTQEASLHLWALTSAAAPKRLRADMENIQRDTKALGEQLKGILALNTAEVLTTTFQAKYATCKEERCVVHLYAHVNIALSVSAFFLFACIFYCFVLQSACWCLSLSCASWLYNQLTAPERNIIHGFMLKHTYMQCLHCIRNTFIRNQRPAVFVLNMHGFHTVGHVKTDMHTSQHRFGEYIWFTHPSWYQCPSVLSFLLHIDN